MSIVSLPLPVQLVNGSVADGGQVMTDLNAIASNVNANAAANGVNGDITSLTAVTSITSNVTFSGGLTFQGANIIGATIDSTTTGVTQPVGTNTNQLATMAAIVNQAFSSSLPGISAPVTDYFVTNNGSVGSWSNLLKAGTIRFADSTDTTKRIAFNAASITTGTTRTITMPDRDITLGGIGVINSTITTSTTLAGQDLYVPIAMTALGQSVTLPNATTVSVGGPHYILDNTKGIYPTGIRDNTGALLMAIAAGGEAYVSLKDNSTQAGIWSVTGTNLEPGLITIDSTFSGTYSSTVLAPFVALDSNTSIHFAALSSGFAAYVEDNAGKVLTTPVTVSSTASSAPKAVFKVSATSAIVFFGASTTDHQAVILTLSGSSPSFSLSVGTPQAFTATMSAAWDGEDFVSAPRIAQLSSTLYLASYVAGTNTSVVAVSVSGATITIGSGVNIVTSSSNAALTTTYALTSTTALVLYVTGGAAPFATNAVVISVSGTTCTVGTPAAVGNSTTAVTSISCLLSATKSLVVFDNNASNQCKVSAVTISGTTVTVGTALQIESATAISAASGTYYGGQGATRYNPHLFPLSASTALLWYENGSAISRAVVLTESSGTMTAGTILYASFSTQTSGTSGFGSLLAQGTTEFIAAVQYGTSNAWKNVLVPHKISGSAITYGDSQKILEFSPVSLATALPAVRLSQGDYIIMGANASALPVFRSNGDVMNNRGSISIPNLSTPTSYPIANVSSNRIALLGGTQGSTVGAATQQLRHLTIEIAQ